MGDETRATQPLVLRGRLVEEQARGAVQNGARMFHAAVLERGHGDEVELGKGVGDARVAFQPPQGDRVKVEDRLEVADHLRAVRFAMMQAHQPSIALGGLDREPARREREEVATEGCCLVEHHRLSGAVDRGRHRPRIGHGLPGVGDLE